LVESVQRGGRNGRPWRDRLGTTGVAFAPQPCPPLPRVRHGEGTGVAKAAAEIADDEGNSVAIQMGLLGDEWNLLIIRLALLGVRRYNEWYEQLGIANSVLTARLRALSEAGVLTRVRYRTDQRATSTPDRDRP